MQKQCLFIAFAARSVVYYCWSLEINKVACPPAGGAVAPGSEQTPLSLTTPGTVIKYSGTKKEYTPTQMSEILKSKRCVTRGASLPLINPAVLHLIIRCGMRPIAKLSFAFCTPKMIEKESGKQGVAGRWRGRVWVGYPNPVIPTCS